jgi:hypothetical protein
MTAYRAGSDADAQSTSWPLTGCRKVDRWHQGNSWLGRTMYRFHQVKRWCWTQGGYYNMKITSMSIATYISHVDTCCIVYHGELAGSQHDYYYTWKGTPTGGHYSFRQGNVANCVLRYGCLATQYPWVRIWVNGNGAWSSTHGT